MESIFDEPIVLGLIIFAGVMVVLGIGASIYLYNDRQRYIKRAYKLLKQNSPDPDDLEEVAEHLSHHKDEVAKELIRRITDLRVRQGKGS